MPSWGQREAAALCMEHLADHDWHGYTQGGGRWGDGEGTCPVETPIGTCYVEQGDRDCSAGVVSAYEAAGISCGGATWTGDALDCMLASGNFRAHSMSDGYLCDDGYVAERGDCYLAHNGHLQHMAMCISQTPDMVAEFYISENGTIYGEVGDQTGWEARRAPFYYGPWNYVLECIVDGGTMGVWDETGYGEDFPTGAPMGRRLVMIDKKTQQILEAVTDHGISSWGYLNDEVNGDRDAYRLLTDIDRKLDELLGGE